MIGPHKPAPPKGGAGGAHRPRTRTPGLDVAVGIALSAFRRDAGSVVPNPALKHPE